MKQLTRSTQFKKDIKRIIKRNYKLEKLEAVLTFLLNDEALPNRYKNHKLIGNYVDYFECHIEPDWLLIYKESENLVELARTGTHADLF